MRYGAVVTANAMFLVQRPIPFEVVEQVWICVPDRGYNRIQVFSECPQDLYISSS